MKRFIKGPDGSLIHDTSFVGEDAWDEDPDPSADNVVKVIDSDSRLNPEQKKDLKEELGITGWFLVTWVLLNMRTLTNAGK